MNFKEVYEEFSPDFYNDLHGLLRICYDYAAQDHDMEIKLHKEYQRLISTGVARMQEEILAAEAIKVNRTLDSLWPQ